MAVQDTSLSQEFHQSVTRAQKVAEFVAAPDFIWSMRYDVERDIIRKGRSFTQGRALGNMTLLPGDEEQIKPAFATLKSEFPDLKHFRVTKGGEIILDTKEDTFMRRVNRSLMVNHHIKKR